uniref:Uncharacterized protein n=1 Tax=Octopus bimaculoides TaxID=37653 RepID=A0A0L8GTK0_OCTBM
MYFLRRNQKNFQTKNKPQNFHGKSMEFKFCLVQICLHLSRFDSLNTNSSRDSILSTMILTCKYLALRQI